MMRKEKSWLLLFCALFLASCAPPTPPIVGAGFKKESDYVIVHEASNIRIPSQLGEFTRETPAKDINPIHPSVIYTAYSDSYKSGSIKLILSITPIANKTPQQFEAMQKSSFSSFTSHHRSLDFDSKAPNQNPKEAKVITKQIGRHQGYRYVAGLTIGHSKYYPNYKVNYPYAVVSGFFFKHKGYYINFEDYTPSGGDQNRKTERSIAEYQP